ncbi:MAG: HEAT repeat domain-containing protein [Coriobacteriia bacterium]|nr:HEAT repeat domain-containing protein [Coriobacteriia bacterium]
MSASAGDAVPRAPESIENFVKQLNITYKAVHLYPVSSAIPRQSALEAVAALKLVLERQPVALLQIAKDGLFHEGGAIFPNSEAFAAFGREFYARNLAEVRFHAGANETDIAKFLSVLDAAPEDITVQGGFESMLWEIGVSTVTVTEASARIVDADTDVVEAELATIEGEPWPPTIERIDELMDGAAGGRPRDQRVLVRVLRDPHLLSRYLRESLASSRGEAPEVELSSRISALSHCVQFELPEDQASLLRSIADAVMDLDPSLRERLFRTRLLEEARRDDSVAEVIEQMGLEEVLDSIIAQIDETPESLAGLSRAIRNLALINVATSRDAILGMAGDKMRAAGASEGYISQVLEGAAPQRLTVGERKRPNESQPVENILRLIDMAPGGGGVHAYDEAIAPLRAEAARGTTDGDVVAALVTLATVERREDAFASIMSLLEDSVGLLVDQHEFEIAADTAEALIAASNEPGVDEAQRTRIGLVVQVLARPEAMRRVTGALRLYRHDSPEHAACRRLLAILGSSTIDSLLEVLADEPDMAARKAVVDLVSGMADRFIPQLGSRINDRRWYFVRNVVAILGATRSREALPYLQRTLKHTDARVRRESIRALSAVREPVADQMLVAALADDDAGNVQIAARYLGSTHCFAAIPALEEIAKGLGHSGRESGPRIEAIEAIGRLGQLSSVPVLQDLARRRGILGGKDRDIRAAATAALGAIAANRAGGGA